MATVTRYADTASSGGDGTTQTHSGGTAAYASQSSAEANMGGSATDDYVLNCAGSTADTTAVTWDFAVPLTTGSLTIKGDATAPDSDGKYNGTATISTGHYRLVPASGSCLILTEANTTVDGLQIEAAGGALQQAINIASSTIGTLTIKNNRLRAASSTQYGIGTGNTSVGFGTGLKTIENNLIVGFDNTAIDIVVGAFFSRNFTIRQNTLYGDGASVGINITLGSSTTQTVTVKGNAIANHGAGNCFTGSAADTYADNACDSAEGTTDEIVLTAANDWTSAGTGQSAVFTVKNTSAAIYNAVNPTLVTLDITGFTRDGTNHDVGAFEFQAAAGSVVGSYYYRNVAGMH